MVQRIFALFAGLPGLMRLGVLMVAAGGASDLLYHAAPLAWAMPLDTYLGRHGAGAHVLTLLGMIVTLLGLFVRRVPIQVARAVSAPPERRSSIEQSTPDR